jgi:hypothetical protein
LTERVRQRSGNVETIFLADPAFAEDERRNDRLVRMIDRSGLSRE